jgi:hypothetical protein
VTEVAADMTATEVEAAMLEVAMARVRERGNPERHRYPYDDELMLDEILRLRARVAELEHEVAAWERHEAEREREQG